MRQDLVYICRTFARTPGFALVAVATLAIGIGLNTALFSIINVLLLKPLPLERPEQLVWISSTSSKPDGPRGNMTYLDVLDLDDVDGLIGATAYGHVPVSAAHAAGAARVDAQIVMGNYFQVLGVRPHRGRLIEPTDDRPTADRVAVISFGLWERLFGGRNEAVGQDLHLNGRVFTIAGVAQRGFAGADVLGHVDVWVAMGPAADLVPDLAAPLQRNTWWLKSIGRLAMDADITSAGAALRARAAAIAQAFPDSHEGFSVRVDPVRGIPPGDRADVRPVSALLLGVTMAVLLIACANVANLLLVKGVSLGRETAIRVALGASRARLLRQHLLECAVLAGVGGALGLLLSLWTADLLIRLAGAPIDADFTPDTRVLGFTLGLSALTALVFGSAPALRASSVAPGPALKTEQGFGDARPRSRLQGALVSGQLALSLVLLLAGALFIKSLVVARSVDVGFNPRGRVALSFSLHMHGYSQERADAFYRALLERVRAQATVRSASLATFIPLGGRVGVARLTLPDRPVDPDVQSPRVAINSVWPQFFETMDIRIVRGRALGDADMLGAASTAVVSETMARRYWPDRNPIGQRFSTDGARGPFVEVVGVARDTIVDELTEDPMPAAYYPGRATEDVALLAWVDGDQARGLQMLEAQVRSLDASVAVFAPKTLEQHIGERLDTERALSRLLSLFGALALLLAAIGLYGVVAYTVARRTREIGVRIALGAQRGDIVRLFVGDASRLAIAGLIVGIPPAIGVTVLLAGSIVGVRIADPLAIGGVTVMLAAVVLLAAYLPARRATRVDPVVALRAQ